MDARARRLVHLLSHRGQAGSYDFVPFSEVESLLGLPAPETVRIVSYASGMGWLKAFGPEAQPLGVSLRPTGLGAARGVWAGTAQQPPVDTEGPTQAWRRVFRRSTS